MKYLNEPSEYNSKPFTEVKNTHYTVTRGWKPVCEKLNREIDTLPRERKLILIETYQGVIHEELLDNLRNGINHDRFFQTSDCMLSEEEITGLVYPDVTDDPIFGFMTSLKMNDFFDQKKVKNIQEEIRAIKNGIIIIYGYGASLVAPEYDLLVYADMSRWEIQLRMRKHLVDNIGVKNRDCADWGLLYKQGFFVDWRVCDRLKKRLFDKWDFLLDTNIQGEPKLIEGKAVMEGLQQAVLRPFSVVPYFDQGPWGGQWMKEVCGLDKSSPNYAWCFNCVPEENSLLLKFGEDLIEIPSVDLVFMHPRELLGENVFNRFGDEFPIRFDFLDTMEGGNLSLQVHPLTEYIHKNFGMNYTQDESYYLVDAGEDARVYLGLREDIKPETMVAGLKEAQAGGTPFDAEKHVQTWPVKKHDHMLIPAGTVHCSGKNCMVLEISATPYIFTFKLWDWGRMGLDGKPRPINIEHGRNVIQWDRTAGWTEQNLVNRIEKIAEGDGWIEEKTGLHEKEFIETRRHWFTKKVEHNTNGEVNVICLVEGEKIIIESPDNSFEPVIIHYAETVIIPACVGKYTISPANTDNNNLCATVKAYIRF